MIDELPLSQAIGKALKDYLPGAARAAEEARRETTQTVVWVVTLASGLLTFAALNRQLLAVLSQQAARGLLGVLMLTVLLGVVQRVVQHILAQATDNHFRTLIGRIATTFISIKEPPAAGAFQSVLQIVEALRAHFGVDYSFFDAATPLDRAQEAYKAQHAAWVGHQRAVSERLVDLLSAYSGQSHEWGRNILQASNLDLESIRAYSKNLARLGWVSFGLFAGCILSFLGAIGILGFGLLRGS